MTIELSSHLELALEHEASRRGLTAQALATQFIESQLPYKPPSSESVPKDQPTAKTLEERWKEHFKAVEDASSQATGPTNLSQDTGRRFTELLVQRRNQGRL